MHIAMRTLLLFSILFLFMSCTHALNFTTEGGNITALHIIINNQSTEKWAGLYGNITIGNGPAYYEINARKGDIERLDIVANESNKESACGLENGDMIEYVFANVTIYAVFADSFQTPFSSGNLSQLDLFVGKGSDDATHTFNFTSNYNFSFGTVSNVPSTYTNSPSNPNSFKAGYTNDINKNIVMVASYSKNQIDWNNTTSDYQIILPLNQSNLTYKIYADVQYNCIRKNATLPEGIFYAWVSGAPSNLRYNFTILLENITAYTGNIAGCWINQSNCGDPSYNNCTRFFLNTTLPSDLSNGNVSLNYQIKPTDSINTTLNGTTSIYVPWEIDGCEIRNGSSIEKEYKTKWRIHVHPIIWTDADIANAFNGKTIEGQFFKNTIKANGPGDVTYAVTKYNGISVEEFCSDSVDSSFTTVGFDEDDTAIDCYDSDCLGITYSCLPKQSFSNSSLFYSPSGSHGTLSFNIPPGDIAKNQTSSSTFNTKIWYTMHSMPNGTFKMRFRAWPINSGNSYLTTIKAEGFPTIKSINKYAPGNSASLGKLLYFIDNNNNPILIDSLNSSTTRPNEFIIKSFDNAQTISNIDTTVNITFLNPSSINMSQGYNINITITYVKGTTVYSEIVTIPIYFDDPTYNGSPGGKWNSTNEDENTIFIDGVNWGACNDTENSNFNYLNCIGREQTCFDQSSYDCYDLSCNNKPGPLAWNSYLGLFSYGLCAYYSESQSASMCFDNYNNDWRTESASWGHAQIINDIDCRDIDCDSIINPSNLTQICQYNIELNCSDSFDNDMYNLKDCELQAGGTYNNAEYDCSNYCRLLLSALTETGTQCNDNIDNDWDKYYTGIGGASGYLINNSYGAGMDCAWGGYYSYGSDNYPDEDCNLTIMGNGKRCELARELSCTDLFDNDYDSSVASMPRPGWSLNPLLYQSIFGISYIIGVDFDDYDCQSNPLVPVNESVNASWCFDNIDNNMDAYYWQGSFWGNGPWILNSSTGKDCADPTCKGITNPLNIFQMCLNQEYNASDPFFQSLLINWTYCENNLDDDADSLTDCHDLDCWKQFDYCGPCPNIENVKWDACADNLDNDYGDGTDCIDSDCIGYLKDYNHHFCTSPDGENTFYFCTDGVDNDNDNLVDCADPNCIGVVSFCEILESSCNDDIDNDNDGFIDCIDSNCVLNPICNINTNLHNSLYLEENVTVSYGGPGSQVTITYPRKVKAGSDYLIRLRSSDSFDQLKIFLGNKNGFGFAYGKGLNLNAISKEGANASIFEIFNIETNNETNQTVIKLWDDDHLGTFYNGFDVTIRIPTTSAYSFSDSSDYKQVEYSHSMNPGGATSGNYFYYLILDNDAPTITKIISEPGNKTIEYGSSIWFGIQANDTDTINTTFHDNQVYACYYNATGPNYSIGNTVDSDCKFYVGNLIKSGTYNLNIRARDPVGNYGQFNSTNFSINIKPKYVQGSFSLTERWYNISDPIYVSARFLTDEPYSISSCKVYYKTSNGTETFAETISASVSSQDTILCNGSINISSNDDMYSIYIIVKDQQNDSAKSDDETFFVCSDLNSNGIGINGEKWDCKFADFDKDSKLDSCAIQLGAEITYIYPNESMQTQKYENKQVDLVLQKPVSQIFRIEYLNNTNTLIHWYVDDVEQNATVQNSTASEFLFDTSQKPVGNYKIVAVLETLYEKQNQTWIILLNSTTLPQEPSKDKHKIEILSALPESGKIFYMIPITIKLKNSGDYDEKDILVKIISPSSISTWPFSLGKLEKSELKTINVNIYPKELGIYNLKVSAKSKDANDVYSFDFEVLPQCSSNTDCSSDKYCENGICIYKKQELSECQSNNECITNLCENICVSCRTDNDCAFDEFCKFGVCEKIEQKCGFIENHKFINYECCENLECPNDQSCISNKCIYKYFIIEFTYLKENFLEGTPIMILVKDNTGNFVENSEVSTELETTFTNEEGLARINVPYDGKIKFSKKGYIEHIELLSVIKKGQIIGRSFVYLGEDIHLKILDTKNNPIIGAEVSMYLLDENKSVLYSFITDNNGEIPLKSFAKSGRYEISAYKKGYKIESKIISAFENEYLPIMWIILVILFLVSFYIISKTMKNQLTKKISILIVLTPFALALANIVFNMKIYLFSVPIMLNVSIIILALLSSMVLLHARNAPFSFRPNLNFIEEAKALLTSMKIEKRQRYKFIPKHEKKL